MINKRGQISIALTVGTLIVIAVILLIIFISAGSIFSMVINNLVGLLGAFVIIIGSVITLKTKEDKNKLVIFIVAFVLGLVLIGLNFSGLIPQQTISGGQTLPDGSTARYAVPHQGAFACEINQGDPKVGILREITTSPGIRIDKYNIGFLTNVVNNIKLTKTKTSCGNIPFCEARLTYSICDVVSSNCNPQVISASAYGGNYIFVPTTSSVDLTKYYIKVVPEYKVPFGAWKFDNTWTIAYDSVSYHLTYSSTMDNIKGREVCASSCDLTCPIQGIRSGYQLITSHSNNINFGESVPVLEYWEDLSVDLNNQFGAPIYNQDNNKFCFGGITYTASKIVVSGVTYTYPDSNTRDQKQCCPGAVISTQVEDKICQSDYTWKTITKETRIKCISDYQCPGAGNLVCRNKMVSGISCGSQESDGFRYCNQDTTNTPVECCLNSDCAVDQTCQNNECVGGTADVPISPVGNQTEIDEKAQCDKLIAENPARWQWVVKDTTPFTKNIPIYGLFVGTSSEGRCVDGYMPYFVLGGIFLVVIVLVIFLIIYFLKTGKKSRR